MYHFFVSVLIDNELNIARLHIENSNDNGTIFDHVRTIEIKQAISIISKYRLQLWKDSLPGMLQFFKASGYWK